MRSSYSSRKEPSCLACLYRYVDIQSYGMHSHNTAVQVVAIKYQNRVNSMVWGDRGLSLLTSLYLTICQFHNYLEVEFLPVHRPSPEEIQSPGERGGEWRRKKEGEREGGDSVGLYYMVHVFVLLVHVELFAESVREEVSLATGIPTSSYSIEDMLLCRSAEKLGLPYHSGLVSYPTVQRELR